jgi:hypothetical protein
LCGNDPGVSPVFGGFIVILSSGVRVGLGYMLKGDGSIFVRSWCQNSLDTQFLSLYIHLTPKPVLINSNCQKDYTGHSMEGIGCGKRR